MWGRATVPFDCDFVRWREADTFAGRERAVQFEELILPEARTAMSDRGLSQLLLGLAREGPDRPAQADDTLPSPSCPPLPRFRSALLREDWTDAEQQHRSTCPYCRQAEAQSRQQTWHPSLVHLFWHVRGLLDDTDTDVA